MEFPPSSNQHPDDQGNDEQDAASKTDRDRKNPPTLLNFNVTVETTIIFILCSAVLLVGNVLQIFDPSVLAFSPGRGMWFPGLISHMFVHGDYLNPLESQFIPWHFLGNMCFLVFLGGTVERMYGRRNYLLVYFMSGIIAALAQASFDPSSLLLGASGALAGVLACFTRHFPHVRLYIWGIIPIQAWLLAVLWIGFNVAGTTGVAGAGVAFIAHLAGFLAGGVISFILFAPQRFRSGDVN